MTVTQSVGRLLARYGQSCEVVGGDGLSVSTKAFLQAVDQKERQTVSTLLGAVRTDKVLYLGEPMQPITAGEHQILWAGTRYEVLLSQSVFVGKEISHQLAVLRPVEEDVA